MIEPVELDLKDSATFDARVKQVEYLSQHYGQPISPLTDDEASMLVHGLEKMSPRDKTQLAKSIGAAPAVWKQLDAKNAGLFAMTGAIGDENIMEAVFRGQEKIKDGLAPTIMKADYLTAFDDYVDDVYAGKDRKEMLNASMAYYAATTDKDEFNASDFEDAMEAVSGGVGKINGYKVELPRNVDEDDFDDYIDEFTTDMAAEFGTVTGYTSEQVAEAVRKGRIVSNGSNRYYVVDNPSSKAGGSRLMDSETGEEFIISFEPSLYEDQQKQVTRDRGARSRAIKDAQTRDVRLR